jgi:hypothetical protein
MSGVSMALVLATVSAWVLLRPHPVVPTSSIVRPPPGPLAQPVFRAPKSLDDLRIGAFFVSRTRGSDLSIAVGDIVNSSENLHQRVKVELDLLDAHGMKIGTANDFVTELDPGQTWHVVARISDPKAMSVRVGKIEEEP